MLFVYFYLYNLKNHFNFTWNFFAALRAINTWPARSIPAFGKPFDKFGPGFGLHGLGPQIGAEWLPSRRKVYIVVIRAIHQRNIWNRIGKIAYCICMKDRSRCVTIFNKNMSILHLSRPIETCSSPSNETKELVARNSKKEKECSTKCHVMMLRKWWWLREKEFSRIA